MTTDKVLIVDDSLTDLTNLEKIIREAGKETITTDNGLDAYELAKNENPDIIFMDIVMDNMDGYEVARMLANNNLTKYIPVVFVSSKYQKADRVWAKIQGGRELISKPYTKEQILEQLEY